MSNWSGIPVWLVRLVWILLFIPGGAPGLLLYVVCWIFIPRDPGF